MDRATKKGEGGEIKKLITTADKINDWLTRDLKKRTPKDLHDIKKILLDGQVHLDKYNMKHMLTPEGIAWKKTMSPVNVKKGFFGSR